MPDTLLICPRWLLPVVPRHTVLEHHAIALKGAEIAALGPTDELTAQFPEAERCVLANHALIPGLINAHAHSPMTLLRGLGDDMPLKPWLEQRIWPVEGEFVGPEFVADGGELAIAEMIRSGTTCCNENYFFPDAFARVAARAGFRATVGLPVIDFPTAWASNQDRYFARALEVHTELRDEPLITTAWAPHAPYTVSDDSFARIRLFADELDIPIHLHLHETREECEHAKRETGVRPFAHLQQLGIVNDRLQAVHMTDLTEYEIAQCAEQGVSVLHCPQSNLKLASGFCPAETLRQAGVNIAVGTDGAASNNGLDMLGELRSAALLGKAVAGDATAIPAWYALEMGTINGARALGLEDDLGSIEVGKLADVAAVDLSSENQPLYDVTSQLIYASARHQVTDVWIHGKQVLDNRQLVTLEEQRLRAVARGWGERITGHLAAAASEMS